jgi:hypothetical protein
MWNQIDDNTLEFAASLDASNSLFLAPSCDELDSLLSGNGLSDTADQMDFFLHDFPTLNSVDGTSSASSSAAPQDPCWHRYHLDPAEESFLGSTHYCPKSPVPCDDKTNATEEIKAESNSTSEISREMAKISSGMKRVASTASALVAGGLKRVDSLLALAA